MGLGKAHGAGPLALHQLGQVLLLLLGVAMLLDGLDCPVAQPRVHQPRPVGGAGHLVDDNTHQVGHALPAVFNGGAQCRPAVVHVLPIGIRETFGCCHTLLAPVATLFITTLVQGRQHVFGKLGTLLDNGIHQISGGFLVAGKGLVELLGLEQLIHDKTDIAQGRLVSRHGNYLQVEKARN